VFVRGLDHVQIAMPRGGEQQARDFYGAVLGLVEARKPRGLADRGGLWFVGPGLHLHLGVEDPFAPARKAHIALLVADLEATRSALEAASVALVTDDADIGVARFYAHDPFGNRIEFVSLKDEGFTTRFSA
jgi:catechol 2,3-dioxygenase-like lactoylglutathione lyase family enzyme